MKVKLQIAAVAAIVLGTAQATPLPSVDMPTPECASTESTVFRCETGKKVVSLCASPELTAKVGTLQYRFGKKGGAAEFVFPAQPEHPSKFADIQSGNVFMDGGHSLFYQVSFENKRNFYQLYWQEDANSIHGGKASLEVIPAQAAEKPAIRPNTKRFVTLECRDATIEHNFDVLGPVIPPVSTR